MNDLNAQQVVLLTLLVSFVTSIATGIVTVSLLDQAPEPVTQTINRVVEKTVERIIPPEENEPNTTIEKTPEKEVVTVVVRDEDLAIDAVSQNSRSLARIYQKTDTAENFVGLGVIFDNSGRIVTDAGIVFQGNSYVAVYQSGKFEMEISYREPNDPYAILKIKDDQDKPGEFKPAVFADSQNLKLAQTVILISGVSSNNVSTGIITNLETGSKTLTEDEVKADVKPTEEIKLLETSVEKTNVLVGGIVVNLKGEIVGARIKNDPSRIATFTPANKIKAFLAGK